MIRTKESKYGSPDGKVANGNWNPDNRKVDFNRNDAVYENADYGFREEISRKGASSSFLRIGNPTVYLFRYFNKLF
ncbi:MAG: hypothetical protein COV70_00690 [Parcubacteria group bacterium CG11_big_fil_rev_8_21_14_0_20_39_22]|nr:MAG: hypothetical protein COV70_00690 [Parcubacteria group bacterium CG11_big_fil_rev_8_21_14_0_20_39_22]